MYVTMNLCQELRKELSPNIEININDIIYL